MALTIPLTIVLTLLSCHPQEVTSYSVYLNCQKKISGIKTKSNHPVRCECEWTWSGRCPCGTCQGESNRVRVDNPRLNLVEHCQYSRFHQHGGETDILQYKGQGNQNKPSSHKPLVSMSSCPQRRWHELFVWSECQMLIGFLLGEHRWRLNTFAVTHHPNFCSRTSDVPNTRAHIVRIGVSEGKQHLADDHKENRCREHGEPSIGLKNQSTSLKFTLFLSGSWKFSTKDFGHLFRGVHYVKL